VRNTQVAIAGASGAFALLSVTWVLAGAHAPSGVYDFWFVCAAVAIVLSARYLASVRRTAVELTDAEEQRRLVDEYRRLADLAITAQEHTDLKLGDMSVRIDHLMESMASLQKILEDVE
jgi:hypothetical protein